MDSPSQKGLVRDFFVLLVFAGLILTANAHIFSELWDSLSPRSDSIELVYVVAYGTLMTVTSLGMIFIVCAFYSHRMAGPENKLIEIAHRLSEGDLSVYVGLRDADHLTGLSDALGSAVKRWRHDASELRELTSALQHAIDSNDRAKVYALGQELSALAASVHLPGDGGRQKHEASREGQIKNP